MNGLVGGDTVRVVFGGEGLDQDGVGACVQRNHDVLGTTARARVESAGVVCEQVVRR